MVFNYKPITLLYLLSLVSDLLFVLHQSLYKMWLLNSRHPLSFPRACLLSMRLNFKTITGSARYTNLYFHVRAERTLFVESIQQQWTVCKSALTELVANCVQLPEVVYILRNSILIETSSQTYIHKCVNPLKMYLKKRKLFWNEVSDQWQKLNICTHFLIFIYRMQWANKWSGRDICRSSTSYFCTKRKSGCILEVRV